MMFIVPGQPASMPRPIFSTRGGFARALTPPKAVSYKAQVLSALRDAMDAAMPAESRMAPSRSRSALSSAARSLTVASGPRSLATNRLVPTARPI